MNGESDETNGGSVAYIYDVPVFNPASDVTHVSRLRLINPGGASAAVTISGRDDSGNAATGGDVTLALPAGGARTLTAQQLEAGDTTNMNENNENDDTTFTGRLGAGTGKWRLKVSSDHPLQVVNIVAATAGYWNNLSTTAISGAAPVSPEAFDDRFAGNTIEYRSEGDTVSVAVQSDNKFTESETSDGVTDESPGGYAYEALGPETGRLTLTHDDGDVCVANLFFASRESGWLVSECTGTDYPDDGYWLGGSWVLAEPENSEPSFPSGSEIEDQEYRAGTAIETLTLPEATGGDGTMTYSLEPSINGLTFDATTRQLSGTPMARAQTFEMTYTVTDEDGDTATLAFDITIQSNRG